MKQLIITAMALFICTTATMAQGGPGGPRMTLEERVKNVMDKLTDFKMDKDKAKKTETVFTDFFKAQEKMRNEMMGGGMPDREVMREKNQELMKTRDDNLKTIFTEEEFKKWKDEIEPSMRPQRQGGGRGNN
jgi:ABC-type transporter MlaC component